MLPDYEFHIPPHARKPYDGCRGRGSVYARVSNENDLKTASMETQAQGQIDALVAAGFFLASEDVRFDRCTGVNSLAFREELLELRDLVEAGHYQAVAFHDPDRLVRGIEVVQVVNDMEAAGCEVWLNGKLSEPSDERDLLLAIGGYASKKEARQIMERTNRVRRRLVQEGQWLGAGPLRYGLVFDKKTRTRRRHDEHAAVVLRIHEMVAGGLTTARVAQTLNAEGVPSPGVSHHPDKARKTLWSAVAINRIVREPTYLGKSYINRWRYLRDDRGRVVRKGKKKVRVAVPRAEWIETAQGKTEAIVPEELWEQANAMLSSHDARRAKTDATRQEDRPYLLRGFLFCRECEQRMYPSYRYLHKRRCHESKERNRFHIYECKTRYNEFYGREPFRSRSVSARKIEAMALPILDALVNDPNFIASSIALAFQEDDGEGRLKREAERTRESLDRLNGQLDGYAADLREADLGERGRKAIHAQMRLIEEQIEAMEGVQRELTDRLAIVRDRERIRALYQSRCDQVRKDLRTKDVLDMEDYRRFMEGFGLRFTYFQGALEVECQPGVKLGTYNGLPVQSRSRLYRNVKTDLPPLKLDLTSLPQVV